MTGKARSCPVCTGAVPEDANYCPTCGLELIEGDVLSDDLWCGDAFGMITQPLMLDLTGSTFAGTRIVDGQLPGDPIPASCP